MRKIIDYFGPLLTQHLTEEIATLLALEKFSDPVLKKAFMNFDEEARKGDARKGDPYTLYPLVMGTADHQYGGESWPAVPFFVRYLVRYWYERRWRGVWRFNPSDTWGVPRGLAFGAAERK